MANDPGAPPVPGEATFFGHPRGLATLFFTEMWERFSYYGGRAILLLFMTAETVRGGLGFDTETGGAIYGLYTFGVYALGLAGGWIADRVIGCRKAVLYGGIFIAAGNYCLVIPSLMTFYLGLLLIVIGTGLLKPNVSAIVGDLYPDKGARRDAGFSIFYMGINLGAFIAPLICSPLAERIDWRLGFLAAAVGMTLGIIQYVHGFRYLGEAGALKSEAAEPDKLAQARRQLVIGIVVIAALVAGFVSMSRGGALPFSITAFAQATGMIVTVLVVLYFGYVITFVCRDKVERQRIGVCALLFLGAALFWSGFEQAGSSMNLFARDYTDRVILGWEMPVGILQSVNPIFIILMAPVMGMIWVFLDKRDRNFSIPLKFAYGLTLLGVGFLVLAWGSSYIEDGKVGMQWLVATYFLHTVGELCLSPVGLSSMTKLAPARLVGQMMGTWFMGAALGNLIAGLVAGYIDKLPPQQLFTSVAAFAIGGGVVFLIATPLIKKMCHGIN